MTVHIEKTVTFRVPVQDAFAYVDDYRNTPNWLYGISKIEPVGDVDHGPGAVFDGAMHLGVTLTSRIRVAEWEQDRVIAFESVKGFRNSSRWTFEAIDDGSSQLTAHVTYDLPLGLAGRAIGRAIEPFVKIAVSHSSDALVRNVEAAADRT